MSHKVFQWASGGVGRETARVTLQRDSLELVGMHVYNPAKVGRDVGELLGLPACGVFATADLQTVLESDADLVLHTPLASKVYADDPDQDLHDICAMLSAGKNVITVVGYMYPKAHGEAVVAQLQQACATGNSSFHSTGLNPGWLGDLIPLSMSALCERIEHAHVLEISSFEHYASPEIMFDSMGFNSSPDDFERSSQRRTVWLDGLFSESIQMMADGMHLGVTEVTSTRQLALAERDLETAAGIVRRGRVAGQHWRWAGLAEGVERIAHETVWRMHPRVAPHWPQGKNAIHFTGAPTMHLEFESNFGFMSDANLGTAMHAVNAIPDVVAAPPGIQTLLDLPGITCRQSF